jgi:hypothetical protein
MVRSLLGDARCGRERRQARVTLVDPCMSNADPEAGRRSANEGPSAEAGQETPQESERGVKARQGEWRCRAVGQVGIRRALSRGWRENDRFRHRPSGFGGGESGARAYRSHRRRFSGPRDRPVHHAVDDEGGVEVLAARCCGRVGGLWMDRPTPTVTIDPKKGGTWPGDLISSVESPPIGR